MAKDKNMNQDAANDEEMTVTLTLDDGTELECVVLTIFEAADKEYIALLPLDGNEAEDGEVYLYRYTEINGTPDIQNIESDEEYEIVADAFDELLRLPIEGEWGRRLFTGNIRAGRGIAGANGR